MSKSLKLLLVLGLAGLVSACAQPEEEITFVDTPVVVEEPSGKF